MCQESIADVTCVKQNCNTIIANKAVVGCRPCKTVTDNNLNYGGCGFVSKLPLPVQKSSEGRKICGGCRANAIERSRGLYDNIAEHIVGIREQEQTRDGDRRARWEQQSYDAGSPAPPEAPDRPGYGSGTDYYPPGVNIGYGSMRPVEQDTIVHGAGMKWSAGEGGYASAHGLPVISDELSELETHNMSVLAHATGYTSRNDHGQDPSHRSGGQQRHRGDQGYSQ
ncbi:hypothetical protein DHEL01_v212787 [Diaporthe helianthi]|uniref:Uncharacterized protein n=1 Tax=Diaporthe helianthi TaxID=158607 RepID=A0A2P5HEX9_DIAHE|nr:hypothetical protein DHEL01_v212787 [Diaporthe helianthi]